MDHVHARHLGTGSADTTRSEWMAQQQRDALAAVVIHPGLLRYVATARARPVQRTRYEYLMVSHHGLDKSQLQFHLLTL